MSDAKCVELDVKSFQFLLKVDILCLELRNLILSFTSQLICTNILLSDFLMFLLELIKLFNLLCALLLEHALQLPCLLKLNQKLVLLGLECNIITLKHFRLQFIRSHVLFLLLLFEFDVIQIIH